MQIDLSEKTEGLIFNMGYDWPITETDIVDIANKLIKTSNELRAARKIVAEYREIYDDRGDLCNLRDPRDMYEESHFKCSCGYEEAQKLLKELDGGWISAQKRVAKLIEQWAEEDEVAGDTEGGDK